VAGDDLGERGTGASARRGRIVSVYPGRFVESETIEVTIEPSDSVVGRDLEIAPR